LSICLVLAGLMGLNTAIYKQELYKYIAPTSPNNLLYLSSFTIDFKNPKFLQVGLNPENNFDVSIHIITSSRHIVISHDFLREIYALMDNILSFILDRSLIF